MKPVRKLFLLMLALSLLFVSCTQSIDRPADSGKTRGALDIVVAPVEGASSYELSVDGKPVELVNGKATLVLDFDSYDIYAVAFDASGEVIAEDYHSLYFNYEHTFRAKLEKIDKPRMFTNVSLAASSGTAAPVFTVVDTILTLNTDHTYEKVELGITVDASQLGTDPSLRPPMGGDVVVGPSYKAMSSGNGPEPIFNTSVGRWAESGDELTLTSSLGIETVYTVRKNALVAPDKAEFGELSGKSGGRLSDDYWSLPTFRISAEAMSQIINKLSASMKAEIDPEIKSLIELNKDLEIDLGFRFFKGNIDIYADVSASADFIDGKLTMDKPVKAGFRLSLPCRFSEKGGYGSIVAEQPLPFVFRRLPGGSFMTIEIMLPAEDTPFEGRKISIPLARTSNMSKIGGEAFATPLAVDYGKTAAQVEPFVKEAGLEKLLEKLASPQIMKKEQGRSKLYSVLGVWTCSDSAAGLDMTVGYFGNSSNTVYGKLQGKSTFMPNGSDPFILTFAGADNVQTRIYVRSSAIEYGVSADGKSIDTITVPVSIGNDSAYKQYTFTRAALPADSPDVFAALKALMDSGNLNDMPRVEFSSDGTIRISYKENVLPLPLKYGVSDGAMMIYCEDIVESILKAEQQFNPGNGPGNGFINPGIHAAVYVSYPYDSASKTIYTVKGGTSRTAYGVVLD